MKSRALQVMDHRSVDVKPMLKPFVPDREALETELQRLANPYIRWEEGTTVSRGDQAVCRLESDCPKFQKEKVRFVAGSGMFRKELEALSIGMSVGETKSVNLPEGKVTLSLTGAVNRVVPQVDDEMAQKLGLEGVRTVEEYKTYLLARQKEEAFRNTLYEPRKQLMEAVIAGSEFVLHKEDWAVLVEGELNRCRVLCRQEGMTLEEMTAEQFRGRIPVKSYHELVIMTQNNSWNRLCEYLLGHWYAKTDGFLPGEEDYEAFIADYVKAWHTTEAQARESNTPENFRLNQYISHAYSVQEKYIREQYI